MKLPAFLKKAYENPMILISVVVLASYILFVPLSGKEKQDATTTTIVQPPLFEVVASETEELETRIDRIPRLASQTIPLLLRPNGEARIAALPLNGTTNEYKCYETPPLKGTYDALWVELPALPKGTMHETFTSETIKPYLPFLKADGILVLDFNARTLNTNRLLTRIRVLKSHFSQIQLWMTGQNRWQLVASQQPIQTSYNEIATLLDREVIAMPLLQANITSPFELLSSCFTSDAIPLMVEEAVAFDAPCEGRLLLQDFSACYDYIMPWVITPEEDRELYDEILGAYRLSRRLAYAKEFKEATQLNAHDPYLLGLAEHERVNAQLLVKLGKIDAALNSYNLSFTYAEPMLLDVLDAANIALLSGKPERAKPYYEMAQSFPKDDPNYPLFLRDYLKYLEATGAKIEAENTAIQLAISATTDEDRRWYQFEAARICASFPEREEEALARAKRILDDTPEGTDEHRQRIQAYADIMKKTYRVQEGILVGLYVKEHGTLIPDEKLPEAILKQRKRVNKE